MSDQCCSKDGACHCSGCSPKCISWRGILAGALTAVGLSFLLSLFGAAIGLSAFHTSAGVTALTVGGFLGLVIGTFAIMFFSGWVAGFLNRKHCSHKNLGALYGFTAWCVALVIMVLIASQTMQFIAYNLYTFTARTVTIDTTTKLFNSNSTTSSDAAVARVNANKINVERTSETNDVAAEKLLARALFFLFAMFFVGAISSALGGYCAQKCESSSCCPDSSNRNRASNL